MIITCPNCATKFEVPQDALGLNGRKLKCAKCGHIWFQEPLLRDPFEELASLDPVKPMGGTETIPAAAVDPFDSLDAEAGAPESPLFPRTSPPDDDFASFAAPPPASPQRDSFNDGFAATLAGVKGPSIEDSDGDLTAGVSFDGAPAAPAFEDRDVSPVVSPAGMSFAAPSQGDTDGFLDDSPFKADAVAEDAAAAERFANSADDASVGDFASVPPQDTFPQDTFGDSSLDQVLQTLEAGLDRADAAPAPLTAPKLDRSGAPVLGPDAGGRIPRVTGGPAPVKRLVGRRVLEVVSIFLILTSLLATGLLVFRSAIVARVPEMLNAYSFLGISVDVGSDLIAFQDIVTVFGEEDGRRTSMTIRGVLHNMSADKVLPLTNLVLRVYDDQKVTLQEVTAPPPQLSLDPQSRIPFEISMRNPPERAKGYFLGLAGTR